jgi:putative hemolysin
MKVFESIVIIVLLFLTAFTAASEISIIVMSRLRLRKLVSGGSYVAKTILKILEAPEKFFSTILVANSIVTTLLASLVTVIMVTFLGEGKGVVVATVLVAVIIIVFEVVAKTLAVTYPEKISFAVAGTVSTLIRVFNPVVKVLVKITNAIIRLMGGQPPAKAALVSEEEIKALIKIGEVEGGLHKEKFKMLSKVFDFSDAVVRSVMTEKKEMVAIDVNSQLDGIIEHVVESGYSRLPVYRDSPDNIIGMINMKDLLNLSRNKDLIVFQDIIYPATFVPETKKITELLKEFQKGHTHLAVVKDSNNKIIGLVTLEDLIEEIVGEIEDEYDVRASNYKAKHLK